MKRLFALLVLLAVPASAHAQSGATPLDELPVLHVTDRLMQRPAAQRARVAYQQRLAQGHPRLKAAVDYEVGDTLDFQVYNFESDSYDTLGFSLQRSEERFLLWVELAQLDSLTDEAIDVIGDALGRETPSGSYNPEQGIIANDEAVFGLPPNVDGDGKSDVLLVDVRDGWQPGEGFVGGFVNGADLCQQGDFRCVFRNGRDILYLDTRPGLYANGERRSATLTASTAAHEYQHLIHLNYDGDEITFVNEGLSEWAEVVNGYEARETPFLTDVARYNVPLFRWSTGITTDVLDDYQRAGLFTNYVAERLGTAATGAIVQDKSDGVVGYRNALAASDLTFEELLLDFHTANLLNDVALDERFGYTTPQRIETSVVPTSFDGTVASETPARPDTLAPGGVLFLAWTDVNNFSFTFDVDTIDVVQRVQMRQQTPLRVVLEQPDGTTTTQDLSPGEEPVTFTGAYTRVTIVAASVALGTSVTPLTYGATWSSTATAAEGPGVAGELTLEPAFPNPFRDRAAIRYHLPRPEHVHLAVYDVLGRRVASLVDAPQTAGTHRAELTGTALASGLYVVRLTAGSRTLTQKLLRVN